MPDLSIHVTEKVKSVDKFGSDKSPKPSRIKQSVPSADQPVNGTSEVMTMVHEDVNTRSTPPTVSGTSVSEG